MKINAKDVIGFNVSNVKESEKNICLSCLPGNVLDNNGQSQFCKENCVEFKYNKDNIQECLFCKNGIYMDKNIKNEMSAQMVVKNLQ